MTSGTLRTRLARVSRGIAAVSPPDQTAHWKRMIDLREHELLALAELFPESHLDVFIETARAIAPQLFTYGPAWEPEESPAIQRWLMQRAAWGVEHQLNPPFPDKIPTAYLDLLIAYPNAEINCHHCKGCGISVPYTRQSGTPGVDFRWGEPLATACPVCGTPVPPQRV